MHDMPNGVIEDVHVDVESEAHLRQFIRTSHAQTAAPLTVAHRRNAARAAMAQMMADLPPEIPEPSADLSRGA